MTSGLQALVASVASLPEASMRRVSAVVGAVVADAASCHLTWIYKQEDLDKIIGDKNPEFWPESKCPFFTLPDGAISCYADELSVTVKSIANSQGCQYNLSATTKAFVDHFGSTDSPYQVAYRKRADKKYPVEGPWIQGSVLNFLKAVDAGTAPTGSDTAKDQDGFVCSLPVYLKWPDLAQQAMSMITTNKAAADHTVVELEIVHNYLRQSANPIEEAQQKFADIYPNVYKSVEAAKKGVESGKSVVELVAEFGKACPIPGSFQGSLVNLLTKDDYVSAVRQNIRCGGDGCARGTFIGACLAAKLGIGAIPLEWIQKVDGMEEILRATIKIYS